MIICSASRRYLLLAGAIGTLATVVWPAAAPDTCRNGGLRHGLKAGRDGNRCQLAPIAPPPIPTAADKLPIAKLKAPKGFKIEVYASGLANARSLRQGDKGTVFVSSRLLDKVYAINDQGRQTRGQDALRRGSTGRTASPSTTARSTSPSSQRSRKSRRSRTTSTTRPSRSLSTTICPRTRPTAGSSSPSAPTTSSISMSAHPAISACRRPRTPSSVVSISTAAARKSWREGIRQVVGMDWHPVLRQLYFTENSRDWLSEEIPEDKLNRLTQPGKDNFGFPYCHQGNIADQEFGWGRSCDEFTKPIALLGPHSAPLGMRFYTGNMFPSEYRNAIFIARHGSWNRSTKFGGDIAVVSLNENGTVKSVDPFITGFIENNNYVGRPADVVVLKDGSLLISDDFNGAVYRVTYDGASVGR